jgi:hypothetical protein
MPNTIIAISGNHPNLNSGNQSTKRHAPSPSPHITAIPPPFAELQPFAVLITQHHLPCNIITPPASLNLPMSNLHEKRSSAKKALW